jgi:hypothetical protein
MEGEVLLEAACELVMPMHSHHGLCFLVGGGRGGGAQLWFTPDSAAEAEASELHRRWRVADIVGIHRRRYVMQWTALELFFADCTNERAD